MLASSTVCPSETETSCENFLLQTDAKISSCAGGRTGGKQVKVHEFTLNPMRDLELRVEIQFIDGLYLSDKSTVNLQSYWNTTKL